MDPLSFKKYAYKLESRYLTLLLNLKGKYNSLNVHKMYTFHSKNFILLQVSKT